MKWSLLLFGLVAIAGTAAACDGLSPGDQLSTEGGLCTLGFLLAAPDGLYFSTAGHCIQVDEKASSPDFPDFGVGAFHFLEPETGSASDGKPGYDFGLIRIHPDVYPSLNPKMCGFEGPTGIYEDTPGSGGVKHWGHGMVFGDLGPTGQRREGVGLRNDNEAFYWVGAGVPGDSGSAVLAEDGRALGILTHLNIGLANAQPVTNGGTHLLRGFEVAAEAGFTQLRLVLAGEDPLAVLAQMRAAPPPAAEEPAANGTSPAAPPTTSAPPPAAQGDENETASPEDANDSIEPAATIDAHHAGGMMRSETPVPALVPLLALALAMALARRKG